MAFIRSRLRSLVLDLRSLGFKRFERQSLLSEFGWELKK